MIDTIDLNKTYIISEDPHTVTRFVAGDSQNALIYEALKGRKFRVTDVEDYGDGEYDILEVEFVEIQSKEANEELEERCSMASPLISFKEARELLVEVKSPTLMYRVVYKSDDKWYESEFMQLHKAEELALSLPNVADVIEIYQTAYLGLETTILCARVKSVTTNVIEHL
ncbi:hypothetical protein [Yersinia phage MHG19]|nr:hypothetical protein [Yersinia phage MHG19]